MVRIDSLDEIADKIGLSNDGPVNAYFVETCYRYMDKYVPMDKGLLRTIVHLDRNSITYMSPYASYQYYGMREDGSHVISHWTTPGTGPYWDQRMISADGPKVIKEVQNYIELRGR